MRKGIKVIISIGIIIVLTILFLQKEVTVIKKTKTINTFRKELIVRDSLIKITNGLYQSAIQDFYTEKELNEELKNKNKELYREIKELKQTILAYQSITIKPKDKQDTIYIEGEIDYQYVEAIYSHKDSVFVKFTRNYLINGYVDNWKFNPVGIDIILIETKDNFFSAIIDTPDWLEIQSHSIKTIPLPKKIDNFDWYTGVGIGSTYPLKIPVLKLDLGFRYKKSLYTIGGTTDKKVWINCGKLW